MSAQSGHARRRCQTPRDGGRRAGGGPLKTGTDGRPASIGIIGPGRLGSSLAVAMEEAGYRLAAVAGRDAGGAQELASQLGGGARPATGEQVARECELVFITVPDGQIGAVAAAIPWRRGQLVAHCSGAIGLEALEPAAAAGALPGCLHPLQSFPSRTGEPERFRGIVCGVEGAGEAGRVLEDVARDLGAGVVRLDGVDRALYHASAVFASNYAVALAVAARRAWSAAGLPPEEAREALAPLLMRAARNVGERELEEALTGPVARGDAETIERHLHALADDRALLDLYRRLGAELLRLDLGHPPDVAGRLRSLLERDAP